MSGRAAAGLQPRPAAFTRRGPIGEEPATVSANRPYLPPDVRYDFRGPGTGDDLYAVAVWRYSASFQSWNWATLAWLRHAADATGVAVSWAQDNHVQVWHGKHPWEPPTLVHNIPPVNPPGGLPARPDPSADPDPPAGEAT